jgi:hypothetical protein
MTEPRTTGQRTADVITALEENRDVWLATASRSGRPHLIPVSAWWDGANVVVTTIGSSRTARNLAANGAGRIALGSPEDAMMLDVEVAGSVPVADADPKLAAGFSAGVGWNPADEDGSWTYYVLRPVRGQAYRGYGELEGRDVMRDGAWLRG